MHFFTLASIFGGALALTESQLAASPLKVEIEKFDHPGLFLARITNNGLETAYFSSFRNPLSEDGRARKVEVYDASNEAVQFLNAEGLPVNDAVPLTQSVKLVPGASVTRLIDVLDNYDLEREQTYTISSEGLIPYRLEGESEWTKAAAYRTNTISFNASNALVHEHSVVESHSRHTFKGCDDTKFSDLVKRSVDDTAKIAKVVADKVRAGKNKEAFTAYFKVDDAATRKTVADRYEAMATTLSGKDTKSIISCRSACTGYFAIGAAWTGPADGSTFFCPAMKSYPEKLSKCMRMNWPGVIMHELSHNGRLYRPSTADTAQGGPACKRLSAAQAIRNADTFNMFGQSMYLDTVC